MKTHIRCAGKLILIAAVLLATRVTQTQAIAQPASKPAAVKFRPQTSGVASVRVTGGSRGKGDAAVTLDVLAPDEIGTTIQEQPSLFWYQSKAATGKLEVTLLEERKVKPLLHVTIDAAARPGIQHLKLSDHGVKLAPGVEYQWVVALVTDPDNRSTDLVASGAIKRITPSAEVKEKISKATPGSLATVYAEAGIWYDALAALSDLVDAQPANKTFHQTRADLLRQVGLASAAQADASMQFVDAGGQGADSKIARGAAKE